MFSEPEGPDLVHQRRDQLWHHTAEHQIHLDSVLDELSLTYGVAPKQTCMEIRGFLTLVIRLSGSLATKQRTFTHESMCSRDFDARELLLPFFMSQVMQEEYASGLLTLTRLRMH